MTKNCEMCGNSFEAKTSARFCKEQGCRYKRTRQRWKKWYDNKDREILNEAQREFRGRSGYAKDWELQKKYGISLDEWVQILESQNGQCAICSTTEDLVVDHCHTTGKVRGALCRWCNLGIGHFRDEPERLSKAARYLKDRLG